MTLPFVRAVLLLAAGGAVWAVWRGHWSEALVSGAVAVALGARMAHRVAARHPERGPPTILLVDDNPIIADLVGHDVRVGLPATVVTAGTVEAAFRLVTTQHFDAAIVDLRLPDGSGIDLIRRIRALPADSATSSALPVIVLSGVLIVDREEVLATTGAFRFLTKPFPINEPLSTLREALRYTPN